MLITVSSDTLSLTPGSEVILRNQTWEDYEQLLALRQDKNLPKLYFNAQNQEIRLMSPLASHGKRIDALRDLVKWLLRLQSKDWECLTRLPLNDLRKRE